MKKRGAKINLANEAVGWVSGWMTWIWPFARAAFWLKPFSARLALRRGGEHALRRTDSSRGRFSKKARQSSQFCQRTIVEDAGDRISDFEHHEMDGTMLFDFAVQAFP